MYSGTTTSSYVPSSLNKDFDPVHVHTFSSPLVYLMANSKASAKRFDWMQPELGALIATHVREEIIHKQVTCHCQFLSRWKHHILL